MPDLEYSTMKEIRDEIHSRFPKYLLVVEKPEKEKSDYVNHQFFCPDGVATAIGLAECAKIFYSKRYHDGEVG
mgnify:CR=1 FL=1